MFVAAVFALLGFVPFVTPLGQQQVISFNASFGSFQLAGSAGVAKIVLDGADWPGVHRAGRDLAADFGRVTGQNSSVSIVNATAGSPSARGPVIIAGTIGKSNIINSLVNSSKIDVSDTKGKWEAFQTQLVHNPMPGVSLALVIAGSDKRGTIYGLYDISEQIGVSPWYWWADVAPAKHREIYALNKTKTQKPPSIKYRGIFLNDEQPALNNWVQANYPDGKYGPGFNADMYSTIFELLLRLRANYIWPAEWNSMFAVDDPRSPQLADEYGVVIGTSHTEPLMRWTKEQSTFLNGTWSWSTNKEEVIKFLTEGVERSRPYESLYTMGMRGLGDTASPTLNASSLGEIVQTQQQILSGIFDTSNVSSIPQMWCLYKEVGGYFQDGLRVPDDITLLWADDNWGNIQRLPLSNETARRAGAGVYYHFDYVGDPRDYKWINTISLQKTWEQMWMAYEKEARQIWVVNVGDLKPLEIPISHFFDLAYDTPLYSDPDSTSTWLNWWATREFGATNAAEIASIVDLYGQYANRRKYELLDPNTYSLINYNEASTVLSQWQNLTDRAQGVYDKLPSAAQPSFFEMVLHPTLAAYTVHQIHINAARNNLYASQRRSSANTVASQVLSLFSQDHQITQRYHALLNGKWDHMMSQTHLGYDYWQQPNRNTIPPLSYVQSLEVGLAGQMGVTVEGSNGSVAGDSMFNVGLSNNTLVLPPMDPYGPSTRWVDIYSRGTKSFSWKVTPHNPWVIANPPSGTFDPNGNQTDVRVLISVDWDSAPAGQSIAFINITTTDNCPVSGCYGNYRMPQVHVPLNNTSVPADFRGFVESDGHVSIEPAHFSRNISGTGSPSSGNGTAPYYAEIPGYGRTLSGVTLLPILSSTQSPSSSSPSLEYDIYFFTNMAKANVTVYLGPSLNTDPARPLKYAVSLAAAASSSNLSAPTTVQPVPSTPLGTLPRTWGAQVSNAGASNTTTHPVTAGPAVLKLWALEPGTVFQKIVVDLGGVRRSYLGPPESRHVG